MLILINSVMLTLTSCQTCPTDEEVKQFLSVETPPQFRTFDPKNPELEKILLLQIEVYYWEIRQLISMRETGNYYPESIDETLRILTGRIDWIKEILEDVD